MAVSTGRSDAPEAQGLGVASTRAGDDHVVALSGELELATIGRAQAEVERAEAGDCRRILFDLTRLEFLDSTGIHFLIDVHKRCAENGRALALVLPRGPVRRVLELSGALAILDSEAVAA